ncbi:hypothetical protein FRC10_003550 [Ceratobasidium sp. 414]|nr:hypothetical protein FRC10_003550 [Ceratobasidium sp. 414]
MTAIYCPETPVNAFLETTIVFADDINKDQLGEYYGEYTNLFKFINISSRNYRKAVFGVLDVISTDSLMIVSGQHLSSPLLSLSVSLNVTKNYEASRTYITYVNGTVDAHYDSSMGPAQIYRDSIYNLVVATAHAVNLDLGNASPNIFLDPSIIHDTLVPNLPPPQISPQDWVRDSKSFYYGRVVPPYQTWAQMLLAGQPQNLTLGNLTELPPDSKIVSNYLCPSYQPKPMSSFLASVFIGTATMYLSVWGTWAFVTKLVATRIRKPCLQCTFGDHTKHGDHGSNGHGDNPTTPDQPTEPAAPPQGSGANSARSGVYKDKKGDHEDEAPIQELPKADPELALGEPKNRG